MTLLNATHSTFTIPPLSVNVCAKALALALNFDASAVHAIVTTQRHKSLRQTVHQ